MTEETRSEGDVRVVCVVDDEPKRRELLKQGLERCLDDTFKVITLDLCEVQDLDIIDALQAVPHGRPHGALLDYYATGERLPAGVQDNGFFCRRLLEGLERWGGFPSVRVLCNSIFINLAVEPKWLLDLVKRNGNVDIVPAVNFNAFQYFAQQFKDWTP